MFKVIEDDAKYTTSYKYPELEEMFNTIDNYVKRNYLYYLNSEDSYLVSYKNVGYEIRRDYDPVQIIYSWYKLGDCNQDYIDLEYVYQDKLTPRQQDIKDSIDMIKGEMDSLIDKGVSPRLIMKSLKIR